MSRPPRTIGTVAGKAYFVKTEKEDKYGRWNQSYATRDGYWVIHRGKKHDVYSIYGKPRKRLKKVM